MTLAPRTFRPGGFWRARRTAGNIPNYMSFRTSPQTGVGIPFVIEATFLEPGDCHTSDIGHWFAMTGNSGVGIPIVIETAFF